MTRSRPLLVTSDSELLDDLLRLASSAGVEVEVAHDLGDGLRRCGSAPLVLIGADLTHPAGPRLHCQGEIAIVCRTADDTRPWDCAAAHGAEHVALLPAAEPWLLGRLERAASAAQRNRAPIVAVLGGRGGAGASVLAAGLAITAAGQGLRTLLVDADPLGGGVDLLLGLEDQSGLRWPQLTAAVGGLDAQTMTTSLPARGDLVVLACERDDGEDEPEQLPAEAMASALEAGRRARDFVVVDLPRHFGAAEAVALAEADRVLLITPAEVRAAAAATRIARMARAHQARLSVVVRGPAPGRLSASDLAKALRLPLAGSMRPEPRLAVTLERGVAPASDGRGPLAGLCRQLIREIRS